jgi:hypothetical protein
MTLDCVYSFTIRKCSTWYRTYKHVFQYTSYKHRKYKFIKRLNANTPCVVIPILRIVFNVCI